jgi:hypothetical protein
MTEGVDKIVHTFWGRVYCSHKTLFMYLTECVDKIVHILSTSAENLLYLKVGLFFFLDLDPHLANVCMISISFSFRDMSYVCVCGNMCMCVRVSTSLESPPIMGNLRCDWAPMSNRFYLV